MLFLPVGANRSGGTGGGRGVDDLQQLLLISRRRPTGSLSLLGSRERQQVTSLLRFPSAHNLLLGDLQGLVTCCLSLALLPGMVVVVCYLCLCLSGPSSLVRRGGGAAMERRSSMDHRCCGVWGGGCRVWSVRCGVWGVGLRV